MNFRLFRILIIILSFFFLTGFVPILSFVGPGVTVLTSGNIYKASAANGSLLSIIGLVVMKAEDHRSINIKGNVLIIMFNKQIN